MFGWLKSIFGSKENADPVNDVKVEKVKKPAKKTAKADNKKVVKKTSIKKKEVEKADLSKETGPVPKKKKEVTVTLPVVPVQSAVPAPKKKGGRPKKTSSVPVQKEQN